MATTSMATRKSIDCRLFPSEMHCTPKIAGTEDEVLRAAVEYAVAVQGHSDTPQRLDGLRKLCTVRPRTS